MESSTAALENQGNPQSLRAHFPWKLHRILEHAQKEELSDVISWLPGGKSFRIHDKDRFSKEIMPHFFKSSTYKSFQRNLNLWGFKGVGNGAFFNENFVQGKPILCNSIIRISVKGNPSPPTTEEGETTREEASLPPGPALTQPPTSATEAGHTNSSDFSKMVAQQLRGIPPDAACNELMSLAQAFPHDNNNINNNINNSLLQVVQSFAHLLASQPSSSSNLSTTNLNSHASANLLAFGLQHYTPISSTPPQQQLDQSSLEQQQYQQQQEQVSAIAQNSLLLHLQQERIRTFASIRPATKKETDPVCDEEQKTTSTSSSVQLVPCRARGMPLDHHSLTAYFQISQEKTPHGGNLYCSHRYCRDGGIKFRYCSPCKIPAAKRNFSTLHAHGHASSNHTNNTTATTSEEQQNLLVAAAFAAAATTPLSSLGSSETSRSRHSPTASPTPLPEEQQQSLSSSSSTKQRNNTRSAQKRYARKQQRHHGSSSSPPWKRRAMG